MNRPRILAAVSVAFVLTIVGGNQRSLHAAPGDSDNPKALICEFEQGQSWTYDAGQFKSEVPAKLAFEIADVDLEGQAATLVMNGKLGGKLRVIRALNANHFLEVANEGFLNLTTVYDVDPATGARPAVHSRHFGIVGQPVFGQYTGLCRPTGG